MLSDLVASSIEPEVLKLLHAVDAALGGVQTRLNEQLHGDDLVAAISAGVQLKALAAWKPAIADIIATLTKPAAPHSAPHDFSGHGH
jgi:hypothetical protein